MTIRTRLTLWYATVFFVSALLIGSVAYYELIFEKRAESSLASPSRAGQGDEREGEHEDEIDDILQIGLWFGLPAAVLGLVGGWFLMRKALAPVAALTRAASQITEHNLHDALPRTGNGDELDRLTEVFNAMTTRLEGSFQRIREFTLHASHELKTPLTVLHGELEAASQEPTLSGEHRERCATQLDEVQRLTKIVDSLTLLTKADAGQVQLARESVRLDDLVRDAHADAQILAHPRNLQVVLGECEPLTITGDRNRLRQLLLNLTDNAVKYNQSGGSVLLALSSKDHSAELVVANTGPGIPPDLLPRVFDPFFRGDSSHNDEIEGCGLGLSIAQWVAAAHQGDITITSKPGDQTVVTVRLPREGN